MSSRQIIQNHDLLTTRAQYFGRDTSDVARASCDKNRHGLSYLELDEHVNKPQGSFSLRIPKTQLEA
jgi:hypothetical protein